MANNLVKNETKIFYTVQVNENVVVCKTDFGGGKVYGVQVSRTISKAVQYPDRVTASKVAAFVDGKLIKHSRTEVITEITEELKLEEEN